MLALSPFLGTIATVRSQAVEEAEDLAAHSGEAWKCIGRTKNPHGGHIYQLRLKEEYDAITVGGRIDPITAHRNEIKLREKAYPAIEPFGFQALYLDPNMDVTEVKDIQYYAGVEQLNIKTPSEFKQKILWQLGYGGKCSEDGVDLFLPDGEAVMANWENLRLGNPRLGPLRILCLKNAATHRGFSVGALVYHVILSVGQFAHDQFAHLIPNLLLIYNSGLGGNPDYDTERSRVFRILGRVFRRIEIGELALSGAIEIKLNREDKGLLKKHLEPITALMGALNDVVNSYGEYAMLKKVTSVYATKEKLLSMWANPIYRAYWYKQFGDRKIQIEELSNALVLLENLERKLDAGTPNKKFNIV